MSTDLVKTGLDYEARLKGWASFFYKAVIWGELPVNKNNYDLCCIGKICSYICSKINHMTYTKEIKHALCFRWNMEWRTLKKHLDNKKSAIATHPETQAIIKNHKKIIEKIIA